VVEFGDLDNSGQTAIPNAANAGFPSLLYNYTSVPQPGLNNRSTPLSQAATVGGGSVVNAMLFDRGSKDDYDSWEVLGNPGWGWAGLQPYFQKVICLMLCH